jgi:hypothetical protein
MLGNFISLRTVGVMASPAAWCVRKCAQILGAPSLESAQLEGRAVSSTKSPHSTRQRAFHAIRMLVALGCAVVLDGQRLAGAYVSPELNPEIFFDGKTCWVYVDGPPGFPLTPKHVQYTGGVMYNEFYPGIITHAEPLIISTPNRRYSIKAVPCFVRFGAPKRLPPTEFPFGPNGPYETASFEFSGYGGSVTASSFGSDFNPDVWGGRAVARIPVGAFRLQADVEGERTSDYSSIVGNRSYFAGGVHADWMVAPTTEIGAFGGLQDVKPTFSGPTSTNYFIGLEGRKFFGPAMFGAQFGRFDVVNGPGTLTNAWFVEGRAKFSVGEAFHVPALKYTIIGGELGYGSGTASVASMGAQTTYWGLGLTQGFANTPVRLSLKYDHFENRVDGLGLVWKENKFMGGLKFLLPNTDVSRGRIEPTVPLPTILRTVMTF